MTATPSKIGYVAIGRNEGARLAACLASLKREGGPVVYVDSGSTDASVEAAEAAGAATVRLDMTVAFTAARARNAGFARLKEIAPDTDYVQFIDGDCELVAGWVAKAAAFLDAHERAAAACGRRRERRPEASLYNRLCDAEWATPPGEAIACGGDVLMRRAALDAVGGYRDGLVAGEEPELCVRLREAGWRIWRLDAEMTLHDAAITRFGQWFRRVMRGGHAFAEVSHLHRGSPCRIWARETLRALAWTGLAPAVILLGLFAHPLGFALLALYPLQIVRVALKEKKRLGRDALPFASFNMLAKFAEAQGVAKFWLRALRNKPARLIEYKA